MTGGPVADPAGQPAIHVDPGRDRRVGATPEPGIEINEPELAALGAVLRRQARAIVACEPARRRASQKIFATLAPLLRANPVTLHDARISIAAGFRHDELPRFLGLNPADWELRCRTTVLGSYQMIAVRRA